MRRDPAAMRASDANHLASALHQYGVPPAAVHAANSLASADGAKSYLLVQLDAHLVLGEDPCLQRPDAVLLGSIDQGAQQLSSNAAAACACGDVDAHLGNSSVNAPARNGAERGPADDSAFEPRHQPARPQMASVPILPFGRRLFERSVTGRDPLQVNLAHRRPILLGHGRNVTAPHVAHLYEV
jgi:hypothetical protein